MKLTELRARGGWSGATWLALFIIVAMTVITVAVGWWVWTQVSDVEIGVHGWIALSLGILATMALGIGLMTLVWRSHYQGYDDEAGHD